MYGVILAVSYYLGEEVDAGSLDLGEYFILWTFHNSHSRDEYEIIASCSAVELN